MLKAGGYDCTSGDTDVFDSALCLRRSFFEIAVRVFYSVELDSGNGGFPCAALSSNIKLCTGETRRCFQWLFMPQATAETDNSFRCSPAIVLSCFFFFFFR